MQVCPPPKLIELFPRLGQQTGGGGGVRRVRPMVATSLSGPVLSFYGPWGWGGGRSMRSMRLRRSPQPLSLQIYSPGRHKRRGGGVVIPLKGGAAAPPPAPPKSATADTWRCRPCNKERKGKQQQRNKERTK